MKKLIARLDDFFYKVILKNILKTSKLGYGTIVTGAESGVNFEHMYDNQPEGKFLIGRFIDKVLLDLPAVHATRGRKEDIKKILWNEIQNNRFQGKKTRVLDLASGSARYLRELGEEHRNGYIESICIDKDKECILLGQKLVAQENLKNIRFLKGDIFQLDHLRKLSFKRGWLPNVVVASGLFIYFNDIDVEKMINEIYKFLPENGLIIFSSYEKLNTRKLMRKTMSTSSGDQWTLYYRKPEHWISLLNKVGYHYPFIFRDHWEMNNIIVGRK